MCLVYQVAVYTFVQHVHVYSPVFLISSYGAPLAQTASYLALHSSPFGPDDYSLLIGSKCILNGTQTNYCWANLAHASKCIKNYDTQCTYYMSLQSDLFLLSYSTIYMYTCYQVDVHVHYTHYSSLQSIFHTYYQPDVHVHVHTKTVIVDSVM